MAKLKMYCIFDNAARAYGAPFPATTPGVAERIFKDMVRNPQYKFGTYPQDYSLHHVGEFDEESAELKGTTPSLCITATQVMESGVDHLPDMDVVKMAKSR